MKRVCESAKAFLKQAELPLFPGVYYVALSSAPIRHEPRPGGHTRIHTEDLVPFEVGANQEFSQLDGFFALIDAVYAHYQVGATSLGSFREPDGQVDAYVNQLVDALAAGKFAGVVNGVVGPRYYELTVNDPKLGFRPAVRGERLPDEENDEPVAEGRAQRFLKSLPKPNTVRSGGHYAVTLGPPPLSDETMLGTCPFALWPGNDAEQQDGMYGLLTAIEDHYGFGKSSTTLTATEDETVSEAYSAYANQIHAALKQGRASGTANGVIGPLQWQLELYANREPVPENFVVAGPESEN